MKTKLKRLLLINFSILIVSVLLLHNVYADTIPTGSLCDPNTVTLNSVRVTPYQDPTSTNLLKKGPYVASDCVGMFLSDYDEFNKNNGNDDKGGVSSPDPNIGQFNDGILNGENYPYLSPDPTDPSKLLKYFTGEEFVDSSMFQDLDGDGNYDDPGWIHLANIQVNDDGDAATSTTYSKSGPSPLADVIIDIGNLLEINFDFGLGEWTLTTKLGIIETAQKLLGPNSFDHLAISFKSSNAFAVYDFDFNDIFGNEDQWDVLNFFTPYELQGTFDAADFSDKNYSHINIWARDPLNATSVPEPSTLILFGVGLAGLGLYARKRR